MKKIIASIIILIDPIIRIMSLMKFTGKSLQIVRDVGDDATLGLGQGYLIPDEVISGTGVKFDIAGGSKTLGKASYVKTISDDSVSAVLKTDLGQGVTSRALTQPRTEFDFLRNIGDDILKITYKKQLPTLEIKGGKLNLVDVGETKLTGFLKKIPGETDDLWGQIGRWPIKKNGR